MKTSVPESMSGVDSAWLRMDSPDNLMMITALLFMGEDVERDRVRHVVATRLLRWNRFRQCVENRDKAFSTPNWVWADNFSLDDHLKFRDLGPDASRAALEEHVAELMSTPLDYAKPLWQFHLLEGYEEGPVLLCRLHHCLADGMALLRVLLSLTDGERDPDGYVPLQDHDFYVDGKPGQSAADDSPAGIVSTAKNVATIGLKGAVSLSRLLFRSSDPKTLFKKPLQQQKRASWSSPISLADVKAIGAEVGGTVNDVLVTAMTGALRRYMVERDGQVDPSLDIRAAIPVNLRRYDADLTMGNQFGLVFLSLPLGEETVYGRLSVLQERMNALKQSAEPVIVYGLLEFVGRTTMWFENQLVRYLANKVTAVVTNVPGPQEERYLAGAPLRAILPWVPQAGRVGIGFSIFSYAGEIRIGVAADQRVTDNPQYLALLFEEEFRSMRQLARPEKNR